MSAATEAELARAREQGRQSALADIRDGRVQWPLGRVAGLSERQAAIHLAWTEAKRETLTARGKGRP